jgi:hypothetical protein
MQRIGRIFGAGVKMPAHDLAHVERHGVALLGPVERDRPDGAAGGEFDVSHRAGSV